jgi:hypothetical protein
MLPVDCFFSVCLHGVARTLSTQSQFVRRNKLVSVRLATRDHKWSTIAGAVTKSQAEILT